MIQVFPMHLLYNKTQLYNLICSTYCQFVLQIIICQIICKALTIQIPSKTFCVQMCNLIALYIPIIFQLKMSVLQKLLGIF